MTAACAACVAAPAALAVASRRPESATQTLTLSVPGLKCAGCMRTVEEALNGAAGVRDARVNLTLKRVAVTGSASPKELVAVLQKAGFDAYPFNLDRAKASDNEVANDLILRLGVAGFAMMNVMLLSVAVWSGASDATRDLFHLISAAIALPATVFAARPFFRNAWSALRVRRLNMDVPISLAIVLAAAMSLSEALNSGAHAYFDAALSLTFFLLIGRVLEHRTRAAAKSAAEDLSALEAQTAKRRAASGAYEAVDPATLKVGDVVQVATGMRVPVDGACLEPEALTDRSFLTGESDPAASVAGDILRAGEINIGAPFHVRATAVGDDTSLRQMARLVETAEAARNSYTSLADRAARIYAPAVHLLALAAFLGWWAATGDLRLALNIAIAVLIITCPCALGLAVPAVATAAVSKLFSLGFLVKSGTALERLAEADTVLFDKTGTLTTPGVSLDAAALPPESRAIAKALAQASDHPVSRALDAALGDTPAADVADIRETPGKGVEGRFRGARVALGRGDWAGLPGADVALFDGQVATAIERTETLRDGARDVAAKLGGLNLSTGIISGDSRAKTERLADLLGVDDWAAEISPDGKHAEIVAAQARGAHVVMVGDGINDAAALSAAHASVAPGSALDAARNAADVVILDPSLARLPVLFRLSRLAVTLSRQNFVIAAVYNAIAIPVALAGFATPMLAALAMSASSLTVLLNALRIRIAE